MKAILRFFYKPKAQKTKKKKEKKKKASTVSCVLSLFLYLEQNVHKTKSSSANWTEDDKQIKREIHSNQKEHKAKKQLCKKNQKQETKFAIKMKKNIDGTELDYLIGAQKRSMEIGHRDPLLRLVH